MRNASSSSLDDLHNVGNFDWKMVLMAGGEILERYGIPRGPKTETAWASIKRGPDGTPIPDVSDKKAGLVKHLVRRMSTFDKDAEKLALFNGKPI